VDVVVAGGRLCARMPALVFYLAGGDAFVPLWRVAGAHVEEGDGEAWVCAPAPDTPVIVRVGRGWGRRGRDRYYLVSGGTVERLVKRPTKRLHTRTWYVCVERRRGTGKWCFDILDGRITLLNYDNSADKLT